MKKNEKTKDYKLICGKNPERKSINLQQKTKKKMGKNKYLYKI